MKKSFRHIITSWVAVTSFTFYSLTIPVVAYAEDIPAPTPAEESSATPVVPLQSCEILGIPPLKLSLPSLGSAGEIYDIGNRYKIYDTTTSKQLSLEGTFLTKPAAARLLVGLQSIEDAWQIELNRILSYNNSCWQYRLSIAQSEVKLRDAKILALTSESARRLQIRDEHIDFLSKNIKPPKWYESGEFWFAIGLVVGIGTTVGAGYAIGQASK